MKKLIAGLLLSVTLLGCAASDKVKELVIGHKETRKEVVARFDTDKDGKLSATEIAASNADANRDGLLDGTELDSAKIDSEAKASPWIDMLLGAAAIFIPGAGAAKVLWDKTKLARAQARSLISSTQDVLDAVEESEDSKDSTGVPTIPMPTREKMATILSKNQDKTSPDPIALTKLVAEVTGDSIPKP